MEKRVLISLFFLFFLFVFPLKTYAVEQNVSGASANPEYTLFVQKDDKRPKVLREFLKKYNSPLADFSEVFVKTADKNKIDWRLLVAISGVESTFAQELPFNSYNAWGWGIYGDNMIYFKSYEEAIQVISKSLKETYIDNWGAQDVYQLGKFYAASPTWAQRVVYFMGRIDKFAFENPELHLSLSI